MALLVLHKSRRLLLAPTRRALETTSWRAGRDDCFDSNEAHCGTSPPARVAASMSNLSSDRPLWPTQRCAFDTRAPDWPEVTSDPITTNIGAGGARCAGCVRDAGLDSPHLSEQPAMRASMLPALSRSGRPTSSRSTSAPPVGPAPARDRSQANRDTRGLPWPTFPTISCNLRHLAAVAHAAQNPRSCWTFAGVRALRATV